jgi:predicted esterase
MITRRGLLVGGAATAGVGAAGVVGWEMAPYSIQFRVRDELGLNPDPYVPDAAEGRVRLEHLTSKHMGDLDLFTAVPAGHGDGAGLPVIVVMHGSSATASVFREIGLARFVTAAVEAGAPPFVLAGTDDGPAGWIPAGGVDPQAMVREELPRWLEDRGYAADRRALWGWSRGGYGALRYVQSDPEWASALALFSPALNDGNPVLDDLSVLEQLPWGLWCAESDPFHDGAIALAETAPTPPDPWVQGPGGHTRIYWNDHTIEMMKFLAGNL